MTTGAGLLSDSAVKARTELPAGPERAALGVLIAEAWFRARDFRSAADAYAAVGREQPAGADRGKLMFQRVLAEIAAGAPETAMTVLDDLNHLGIRLALDDFGTGYSSLSYLKRFPVEAIKVDRQFVKGLGIDAEDTTIVEAVVNLGRSLGLMVVAEGVETPLQLSRLREMGCDRAQGYLFGRPRPAALIEAERANV